MILSRPVKIPDMPGKILIQTRGNQRYVMLVTNRKYDPEKKYSVDERKVIGVVLEEQPDMMLPNENYELYLQEEKKRADEMTLAFERERSNRQRVREYFEQVYFEFMALSRRMPEVKLTANKARRINQVLRPMMEILREDDGAELLEFLPEEAAKEDDRMSYSDAGLLLTLWKTAVNRHFMKMR